MYEPVYKIFVLIVYRKRNLLFLRRCMHVRVCELEVCTGRFFRPGSSLFFLVGPAHSKNHLSFAGPAQGRADLYAEHSTKASKLSRESILPIYIPIVQLIKKMLILSGTNYRNPSSGPLCQSWFFIASWFISWNFIKAVQKTLNLLVHEIKTKCKFIYYKKAIEIQCAF